MQLSTNQSTRTTKQYTTQKAPLVLVRLKALSQKTKLVCSRQEKARFPTYVNEKA